MGKINNEIKILKKEQETFEKVTFVDTDLFDAVLYGETFKKCNEIIGKYLLKEKTIKKQYKICTRCELIINNIVEMERGKWEDEMEEEDEE